MKDYFNLAMEKGTLLILGLTCQYLFTTEGYRLPVQVDRFVLECVIQAVMVIGMIRLIIVFSLYKEESKDDWGWR